MSYSKIYIAAIIAIILVATLFYYNVIPYDSISGWVALIISIFGIYYSYEALLMNVKMKHSEDLHKFISDWCENIKNYQENTLPALWINTPKTYYIMRKNNELLYSVSSDILYQDLLDNHTTEEKNLKNNWVKYLETILTYENDCNHLMDEIRNSIFVAVRSFAPDFEEGYNYNGKETIFTDFANAIFLKYLDKLEDNLTIKTQLINYSIPIEGISTTYQVHQISASAKDNSRLYQIIATKDENLVQRYIDIFNTLYEKPSAKLVPFVNTVRKQNEKVGTLFEAITRDLTNLNKYPVFGEKCEFVKRAL
jgi:hypothetical protein